MHPILNGRIDEMNRKLRISLLIALAALVMTVAVGLAVSANKGKDLQPQAQDSAEEALIHKLQEQLKSEELSVEGRSSLEEKLALAQRSATQQAASGAARRSEKNPPPPEAAVMEMNSEISEGIFEGSQGLVRPGEAEISNLWQGAYNGTVYQVFAGATADQPARGLLMVAVLDEDRPTGTRQIYLASQETARLRIIAVVDGKVLVETDSGMQFSFNLDTRIFDPQ